MSELKPCPFCGGKIHIKDSDVTLMPEMFCPTLFVCDSCGAMISFDDPVANAAKKIAGDNSPAIKLFNKRYGKTCIRCGATQVSR